MVGPTNLKPRAESSFETLMESGVDAGTPLTSGGLAIRLADPDEVQSPPRQTVA